VALKIAINRLDSQYSLPDIKEAEYTCFLVSGPEGIDSGGQPLRCYVKKGTRMERVLNNAKSRGGGKPEEWYVVKGIARPNRQMVVEVIEKTE
jgi:hypothetical protein